MNKTIAIFLLTLFIFNTIGYRLFISYMGHKMDVEFVSGLDEGDYSDNDLIALHVPVNLPYQNNWKGYERIDGEITVNGRVYKYVKRKLSNDTMTLLCIRHDKKTGLEQKAINYFEKINDTQRDNENSRKTDLFKQLFSDFDTNAFFEIKNIFIPASGFNMGKDASLPCHYIPVNGEPPDNIV